MKFLQTVLSFLICGVVSSNNLLSESDLHLAESTQGSIVKNDDGFNHLMDMVKGNLSLAIEQSMEKLDSILLLKRHAIVSKGLRDKISGFKENLTRAFEDDLRIIVNKFKQKRLAAGQVSDQEKYECSEAVKEKWEETLADHLASFSKILPRWVQSVIHVWKGLENTVIEKIQKFKKFVHRSYPRSQESCSLPQSILLGSEAITKSLSTYGDNKGLPNKSPLLKVFQFISAVVGGIVFVIGSLVIITLYFVAYIIGTIMTTIYRLLGGQTNPVQKFKID